MKIGTRLTLSVLTIVLIILVSSMGAIYLSSKSNAEEIALNLALSTAREYASQVEKSFDELVCLASDTEVIMKRNIELGALKTADVKDFLTSLLEKHANIYSIGLIAADSADSSISLQYKADGLQSILVRNGGKVSTAVLSTTESEQDFSKMLSENHPILSESRYDFDGQEVKLVSLYYPVNAGSQNALLIRVDLAVEVLQSLTESITIFDSGFARILSYDGVVVTHKDINRVGDVAGEITGGNTPVAQAVQDALHNGLEYNTFSYSASTDTEVFKSLTPIHIAGIDTSWSFGTIVTKDDMYRSVNELTRIIAYAIAGSVITIIFAMIFLSRIITKPIVEATSHAAIISELDFTKPLSEKGLERKDEIGNMLRAFDKLQLNIKKIVENIHESSQEVGQSSDELRSITAQFSRATEEIAQTVGELAMSATEQASSTEEGANKAVQLGDSITLVSEKIQYMKDVIDKVYEIVEDGNKTVHQLIQINEENNQAAAVVYKGIHDTNLSVEDIARSSAMIAQIADQTNLLALNAAIESARAGEAGRGFSVVAEEIRKLAEESGKLTNEINSVIASLRSESKQSVESIEIVTKSNEVQKNSVLLTKERFEGIHDESKALYDAVGVLFEAGADVNAMKNDILEILSGLAALAEENAASTEETSASTQEQTASLNEIENQAVALNDQAINLDRVINTIKF